MLYSVCMRNGPVGDEMNWKSEQECEIRGHTVLKTKKNSKEKEINCEL